MTGWWRRVKRRLRGVLGGGDVAVALDVDYVECGNRWCEQPATQRVRWLPSAHGWIWEDVCDRHARDLVGIVDEQGHTFGVGPMPGATT